MVTSTLFAYLGASLSGREHHAGFLDPASMFLRLFG
jgi:hypothetical protein